MLLDTFNQEKALVGTFSVIVKMDRFTALIYTPSVLVPGLDLRVREVELGGELHPVLHREVLLPLEAGLQRLQLRVSEGRPCLPLLLGEAGGVGAKAVLVCKESRL